MNCLSRDDVQCFIDKEVTELEMTVFLEHLKECEKCKALFEKAKEETDLILSLLSSCEFPDRDLNIPEFKKPVRKIRQRIILLTSSAAAGLIAITLSWFYLNHSSKQKAILEESFEVEQYLYNSDLNKVWKEKEPLITIINSEGEIIYSSMD